MLATFWIHHHSAELIDKLSSKHGISVERKLGTPGELLTFYLTSDTVMRLGTHTIGNRTSFVVVNISRVQPSAPCHIANTLIPLTLAGRKLDVSQKPRAGIEMHLICSMMDMELQRDVAYWFWDWCVIIRGLQKLVHQYLPWLKSHNDKT